MAFCRHARWSRTMPLPGGRLHSGYAVPCLKFCVSMHPVGSVHCGLTIRSSGAPTACHQAQSVVRSILHSLGLAASRCRPLSSNVRHQNREPRRAHE